MSPSPTRPSLAFADLAGQRVGIWGFGVEGRASAARLAGLGASLVVVDDQGSSESSPYGPVLTTETGGIDALLRCDAVVKTPGISRYRADARALVDAGVPLVGGLGLWLHSQDLARVVVVTGTKGKSTTTSVLGHLLRGLGYRVFVGGNLGAPPFAPGLAPDAASSYDFSIIETSSFQATDLAVSPPITAVTSLHPDHLDWHGDVATYFADKLSATTQTGCRLTVANGDDELVRAHKAQLGPEVDWVTHRTTEWVTRLGVLGVHNERNALLAQRCAVALGVTADDDTLLAPAMGFEGLPSRLRIIATIGSVDFVDDSLATNVLPTTEALATFPDRKVAIIVGGHDRGIDYAPLAAALGERDASTLAVTLPESGTRIHAEIRRQRSSASVVVHDEPTLRAAVERAYEFAAPDGVVLLSPAAPSFGQFRDYADRSSQFADAVAGLAGAERRPARSAGQVGTENP